MWEYNPKDADLYKDDVTEPDNLFDDYENRGDAIKRATQKIGMKETILLHGTQGGQFDDVKAQAEQLSEGDKKKFAYQHFIKAYLRCVASIDENIGRMLEYLKESGLADDTIVIYTSDQGVFLGEHGLFDKRYMYEESLRTPLVIRYPDRIEPGLVCHELVQNLDIAPTILDVAGAEIPGEMQGQSLQPLFQTPAMADWRDAVYYQFFESGWGVPQHYGIRTKTHKLIHFLSEPENWELYNLETDPNELANLYDNQASQQLIKDLKFRLRELQDIYKVPE